jgi:hypothetical protein
LLVGRQFPAHRFERFGDTHYLLDPTTGRVCDPFKIPNANPVDQALSTYSGYGPPLPSPSPNNPPPCGK